MPTPLRVSEANDIEFSMEIPELDVKMSKKAKKVRANLKKDKHTIVNTETYKKWISEPDAVKDILRAPQPIAANRAEARGRRYQTLAAQGKLIETMVKEPLQVRVCVCVGMCICMHVYVYVTVNVYICKYIYIYIYICIYIYTYVYC